MEKQTGPQGRVAGPQVLCGCPSVLEPVPPAKNPCKEQEWHLRPGSWSQACGAWSLEQGRGHARFLPLVRLTEVGEGGGGTSVASRPCLLESGSGAGTGVAEAQTLGAGTPGVRPTSALEIRATTLTFSTQLGALGGAEP